MQNQEPFEEKLEVNTMARKKRHDRIFDGEMRNKVRIKTLKRSAISAIEKVFSIPGLSHLRSFFTSVKNLGSELVPTSPQRKLLFQGVMTSILVLVVSMINPISQRALSASYEQNYIDAYFLPGEVLVADDYGYLVKINPGTADSNRKGLTDFAIHKVAPGESLSVIAEQHGVSSKTIQWENNISNVNSIRVGQQLYIPPVNGVSYTVKSNDTLEKIADNYGIEVASIIAQNNLGDDTIKNGQKLFLPGAERKAPVYVPPSNSGTTQYTASTYVGVTPAGTPSSDAEPVGTRPFIFPTQGRITQGYNSGHYAYDIADRSKPPIWAAGSGTVTKVSVGTWGGGYGNHVIIDHGNGLRTLYAHMDSVNVSVGQYVNQGDVLGIMGNTGRVYGVTGIHLHWEVIQDGVKKNPGNYY